MPSGVTFYGRPEDSLDTTTSDLKSGCRTVTLCCLSSTIGRSAQHGSMTVEMIQVSFGWLPFAAMFSDRAMEESSVRWLTSLPSNSACTHSSSMHTLKTKFQFPGRTEERAERK